MKKILIAVALFSIFALPVSATIYTQEAETADLYVAPVVKTVHHSHSNTGSQSIQWLEMKKQVEQLKQILTLMQQLKTLQN